MASGDVCLNCGSSRWHVLNRWERFVEWAGTGPGTQGVRCADCGASQSSGGWYRPLLPGSGPLARLRQVQMVRRQLRFARNWQPVPIFDALVVAVAAVPGVGLALLTRRRWLALVIPLGAFAGTFLLSVRSVLEPHNRELVREMLDPVGAHRRQAEQEIAALRRDGAGFPIVVPANWDGEVRLVHGSVARSAADATLRAVRVLAGQPDDGAHPPRLDIRVQALDAAAAPDELTEQVAFTEAPPEGVTADAGRLGTPTGHGDDDILVLQMPDPSPERLAELADSWQDATLLVDGEPVAGRLLVGRRVQIGTTHLGGHQLVITGHDVDLDGLALRRVTDLGALIAAFERDRLDA